MNLAGNTTEPTHPRDDDATVLEGLTETLDRVATELRELVQEEHSVVREGARMYLDGLG